MENKTKKYDNGDITVVWQPDKCIHSTMCWNGLGEVFNPKKRPWIDMQGAATERIIDQVKKCPSGALSYVSNEPAPIEKETINTIIEPAPNGPLMIYGNITINRADGTEEHKHNVTALCRCGASANKPFCDGSHTRIGFKDE